MADMRDQEERATRDQAAMLKLPYCDIRIEGTFVKPIGVMDQASMEQLHAVPLRQDNTRMFIGVTVKTPQSAMDEIRKHFESFLLAFEIISESAYREILERYAPPKKANVGTIDISSAGASTSLTDVSTKLNQVNPDEAFLFLTTQAISLGASDIHLEPARSGVRIRFRMDGLLHHVALLSHEKYDLLQIELSSRAGVRRMIAEPQAGRFSQSYIDRDGKSKQMSMRVETMPVLFGTEVVIRLFNLNTDRLHLDKLDLDDKRRMAVEGLLRRPYGMALVVGPTGSGKTTTLYTFINELNSPQRKIITLEDPVEYELDGITQIPVSQSDQSFSSRLEAVLREDPDIIMIGEIRNFDTARTALQAALTGHLVLSTFHAGSAAAALSRMLDMIQFNPLLASAVRMIIAQRLLRKLCEHCKQAYEPEPALKTLIAGQLAKLPEGEPRPDLSTLQLFKPVGCNACNNIGYKDRVAVREMLIVTPEFEEILVRQGAHMSMQDFEQEAVKRGMRTLLQDALLRVVNGETSVDELSRTTDIR
jgi:type II secretory ATPase GspE/PulE/Tfp pilus assembly ATPase PilB-like protein